MDRVGVEFWLRPREVSRPPRAIQMMESPCLEEEVQARTGRSTLSEARATEVGKRGEERELELSIRIGVDLYDAQVTMSRLRDRHPI